MRPELQHSIAPLRPTTAKVLATELSAQLNHLRPQPALQLAAMREFVARPDTASWTAETIRRILSDRGHLAEIAAQSFAHPNGFDSIVLENSLPSHRVRLHIWWPETQLVTEDVHNHAWSFASRVLSGALHFRTYRPSGKGTPFFHYPYRYGDTGACAGNHADTVNLVITFDGCFPATMYYSYDLNELHRIAPIKTDQPVATLVLTGTLQRDGSDVYTEQARHGEGYRLLKEPYTANQLADRLRRYLACL
ncbi:hypothetical protein [Actinoplanes sp. NPDC049316]|uniref:hypothetical protein n=1 Tax=Actinoplanes sp. NPDC049316 TaxID=3154727 RepID=UPI00343DA737